MRGDTFDVFDRHSANATSKMAYQSMPRLCRCHGHADVNVFYHACTSARRMPPNLEDLDYDLEGMGMGIGIVAKQGREGRHSHNQTLH